MPTLPKSKPLAVLLAVAALLALPAAAHATLTYTKGFTKTHIYYAADNGKGAHRIGLGRNSRVSPDGETVIYEREAGNGTAEMRLFSIAAGKSERLMNPWREGYVFAWSPNSEMVAALRGGLNGPATLVVIDVATGRKITVARGYVNGVSFSPEGDELVYGLSRSSSYPPKTNIFRYSIATGLTKALSHDGTSGYPLWGPRQIVFVRLLGGKQRKYGPKNELFVMNEEGERISQLTHTTVDPLTQGLFPTAWSASGNQLLAEYGGQDTSYAVAINPNTGGQRNLSPGNTETGFVGVALSPNGRTVLGYTGGYEGPGSPHPKIVTVPFRGGRQKTLVTDAFEPSWGG